MKKVAYCKINLTLEILGTWRSDGFHDIKSVMHKIPLGDSLDVELVENTDKIVLICDRELCAIEDNLAYRAAKKYLDAVFELTGKKYGAKIILEKITPSGAGLGGGSADAATVLDILQKQLGVLCDETLLEIASALGSDVPFCLERYKSALCTGRGEICKSIQTLPKGTSIIIAKPKESINTKGIYGEYDKKHGDDYSKCKSEGMVRALQNGNVPEISKHITNDFEEICISRLPKIGTFIEKMRRFSPYACGMSGSGSATFALFDNDRDCNACFDFLKNESDGTIFRFTSEDFEKMYKGE